MTTTKKVRAHRIFTVLGPAMISFGVFFCGSAVWAVLCFAPFLKLAQANAASARASSNGDAQTAAPDDSFSAISEIGMTDSRSMRKPRSERKKISSAGFSAGSVLGLPPVSTPTKKSFLNLRPKYISAELGNLALEGGLLKVSWGKADSLGPLDVVSPPDRSDPADSDFLNRKIAQLMVHGSYAVDSATKVEAVFIPGFTGETLDSGSMQSLGHGVAIDYPDTKTLKYSQAGLRLMTAIGASDIGFQYYYGNLATPAITGISAESGKSLRIHVDYNRYSQIGADFASAFGAMNVRGELAANITEDLSGDDGSVYNPSILWSLGSDRTVLNGLNLNAQLSGAVRLMDDRIGTAKNDTEAGTSMTKTTVTVKLVKKLLQDKLALSATTLYGIEDSDCLLKSAISWTKDSRQIELSSGAFAGNTVSNLGQFFSRDFVKLAMTCTF